MPDLVLSSDPHCSHFSYFERCYDIDLRDIVASPEKRHWPPGDIDLPNIEVIEPFEPSIFLILHFKKSHPLFWFSAKPLLMLQSLKRILKLNIDDYRVHFCVARFQLFVESNQGTMAEPVAQVIAEQAKEIFSVKSAKERNELFMQKNSSSLDHRVVGKNIKYVLVWNGLVYWNDVF